MDSSTSFENVGLMSTTNTKKKVDDENKSPPTLKECSPTWLWRVGVHLLLLVVPIAYLGKLNSIGSGLPS